MQLQEFQSIVGQEIKQREEELCDVSALREEYSRITSSVLPNKCIQLESLLEKINALESPLESAEPSCLEEIRSLRPSGPRVVKKVFSYADLYDR